MTQPLDPHLAFIGGILSTVFAFVFDQPTHVVFAAFSGTLFAVAMLDSMPTRKALLFIAGGTFLGAMVTHAIGAYFEKLDPRFCAFISAYLGLFFRESIVQAIKNRIEKWGA